MIEVFKDKAGEWRFRVKAKNGRVIAQSEGYKRVEGAEKGISALEEALSGYYEIKWKK